MPAAIGGPTPNVGLSYDSSTQDGRIAGTNNQSSWIGDGWDSAGNYIERTYAACSDDSTSGAPQYSGDLCWKGQVLTLSLNGQSAQIVYDDATGTFRAADDSAKVAIDRLTSCQNGTYNSECWRVTENGTQYYFGLNELPGWAPADRQTQSAWTVPVYGAHSGDPCNAATFAASSCAQAWRWNLDYVVDPHGNAAAYYYTPEYNNYGADMQTTPVKYTRGGYLSRIDYGMTAGTVYSGTAPEQIVFSTAERCGLPGTPSGATCTDANFTVANASWWPDVPIDQDCWVSNAGSCPNHSPTFWTRRMLTSIVTQVQASGATRQVDRYDLTQSFPQNGDNAPTLWLDSIVHTGLDASAGGAGTAAVPKISFDPPLQLANRVGTIAGLPAIYHNRIHTITTETGATITVSYAAAACTPSSVPADPSANTGNCFPAYWAPYGAASPELDWFNKYPVTSVETQDKNNANPDGSYPELLTQYKYPAGGAAWHYDDNEVVKPADRTYGQFRGYAWVETLAGDPGVFHFTNGVRVYDQQTLTRTSYFQGMSNDTPSGSGGSAVTLTSLDGKYSAPDANAVAGMAFETDTYTDATGSAVQSATVNVPQVIGPTASRARSGLPPLTAQMVRTAHSYQRTAVSYTPGWRYTQTDTFYTTALGQPTTGMPVQVDDRGEVTATGALAAGDVARCTWTRYVSNPGESLVLPAEAIASDQDCTSAGATPTGQLISDTRTSYDGNAFTWDGASPAGTAPSQGSPTAVAQASGAVGGATAPGFVTTSTTSYDSYGRPLVVTRTPSSTAPDGSSLAQTVTTAYTPATGALPTQVQTRTQVTAGSSPAYQTSTTTLDPARSLPVRQVSIAGLETDLTYDALGRLTAVWLPNESKAASAPASYTYSYTLAQNGPSVVATSRLLDGGGYAASETLYDAMLRSRQAQATGENSSILVTDTQYNSLGSPVLTSPGYSVSGSPGTVLVSSVPQKSTPETTVTDYDGLGRPDLSTTEHDGTATATTVTAYAGDHTTVIPPAGGVTQATYANARGQVTELDQYTAAPSVTGNSASGYAVSGGTASKTTYAYTPAGQQSGITGPDGSTWTSTYDLLGRHTRQSDPDAGTSTSRYDDAGNLVATTDARGVELDYTYDLLGRKLTATDKTGGGFEFASWTYDTLQAGQLTSSTRYYPGVTGGYTEAVTGYTSLGKPTGLTITLPSSESPLPATYTTGYGYSTSDQNLSSQTDPRTQGLLGESITYGYDALGNPVSTKGLGTYVAGVTYTSYGEPGQVTLGPSANEAFRTYTYDDETRRLLSVQTNRTQAPGPVVDLTSYTYDPAGNLTSASDAASETGSTVTGTQCYGYDALNRLKQAWTDTGGVTTPGAGGVGNCVSAAPSSSTLASGPFAYWQSYGYDAIGDRLSETDHPVNGAAGDATTTYTNGGTPASSCANTAPQPHTLTKTSVTGPSGTVTTGFCYDKAGDTVSRTPSTGAAQSMTWDDQGELASLTQGSGTTGYVYDAGGNLLIRRDPGQTTLFAGDTEIVVSTSVTPHALLGAVRTYTFGGSAVAVRSSLPGGGTDYLISDPHGTATLAMDTTTQAVTRQEYTPYGQVIGGGSTSWPDPTHGYLGKPSDAATGYTDLGAREYDPAAGRFLSADPLLESASPQQLGGYTYAADNPVTGSDPTGLRACLDSCESGGPSAPPSSGGGGNYWNPGGGGDDCYGPGGEWLCGNPCGSGQSVTGTGTCRDNTITITTPAGDQQSVDAAKSTCAGNQGLIYSGPSYSCATRYKEFAAHGYQGSTSITYQDLLDWAKTSDYGWGVFCTQVLGGLGSIGDCNNSPLSGHDNVIYKSPIDGDKVMKGIQVGTGIGATAVCNFAKTLACVGAVGVASVVDFYQAASHNKVNGDYLSQLAGAMVVTVISRSFDGSLEGAREIPSTSANLTKEQVEALSWSNGQYWTFKMLAAGPENGLAGFSIWQAFNENDDPVSVGVAEY